MADQMLTATQLGGQFGVDGDVMNVALRNAGILEGGPGNWGATAAATEWINERDLTNGRHPDPRQNPYFTLRKFDPDILDAFGVTPECVAEAKREVAAKRAAQAAQLKADRAAADDEFLASQAPSAPDAGAVGARVDPRTMVVVAATVLAVAGTAYLVVKYVPPVRRRWDEKVVPKLAQWAQRWRDDHEEQDD